MECHDCGKVHENPHLPPILVSAPPPPPTSSQLSEVTVTLGGQQCGCCHNHENYSSPTPCNDCGRIHAAQNVPSGSGHVQEKPATHILENATSPENHVTYIPQPAIWGGHVQEKAAMGTLQNFESPEFNALYSRRLYVTGNHAAEVATSPENHVTNATTQTDDVTILPKNPAVPLFSMQNVTSTCSRAEPVEKIEDDTFYKDWTARYVEFLRWICFKFVSCRIKNWLIFSNLQWYWLSPRESWGAEWKQWFAQIASKTVLSSRWEGS